MTVSAQDLADYSPFYVSDTDAATVPRAVTTSQFTKYAALAKIKLDRDNPGLGTAEYDHGHALLIAHYIVARQGGLDKSSESLDSYRIEKKPGMTSFLVQYNQLMTDARDDLIEKPTQLIAHYDTNLGSLKLDKNTLPALFDPDDVDGELYEP